MSFPYHDRAWMGAAEFVRAHRAAGESILAPDAFLWWFDHIHRYANTRLRPEARYEWAIVHNWMLHHLGEGFLAALDSEMRPVHAGDTFVVWRRSAALPRLSRFHHGVATFRRNRRDLLQRNGRYAPGPEHAGPDPVLPDPGTLFTFKSLPRAALKGAYERFYENGGYLFPTHRDQTNTQEIDRNTRDFLGDTSGLRILDVGCGVGRVPGLIDRCASLVGFDLAEFPVRICRERFADRREFQFAVMKAEALALPDASFDLVTMIDASEHVYDFETALAEAARVLRPGGRFIVTAQNTNSLHLIVNRKLGYPNFLTNNQHFREFTVAEMSALVGAYGFAAGRSVGFVLYPYWEIPGIDEHARRITDDDGEFAELMRVLGQRVGPEYAYTFMLEARKAG